MGNVLLEARLGTLGERLHEPAERILIPSGTLRDLPTQTPSFPRGVRQHMMAAALIKSP